MFQTETAAQLSDTERNPSRQKGKAKNKSECGDVRVILRAFILYKKGRLHLKVTA